MIKRLVASALCASAFVLLAVGPRAARAGVQTRSVARRIQEEQLRRNARIQAEAKRRREEYERQRQEFKRQVELRRRSIARAAGTPENRALRSPAVIGRRRRSRRQ
ncbi:MAG TPA: hypothetical protein VJ715_09055 [Pyrinomonadaceae bacterium]|nr:hypothetical protein [Pyrinomonadaceae bacterium]